MLDLAIEKCKEYNVEYEIKKSPGSYDIPLDVKKMLKKDDIDGVVTLGAVIQGKTHHDIVIMKTLTHYLTKLSLKFEKPVMLGVNGPRMTKIQAIERIKKSSDVTEACIKWIQNE